jgi:hypothetical protein
MASSVTSDSIVAGRSLSLAERMASDAHAQNEQIRARRELPTEGKDLVRVVNAHGGAVCGIEPGHTGMVNPRNAGVQGFIAASMLVLADATDEQSVAARVSVDRDKELAALRDALKRAETESTERLEQVNALEARVRDLQQEVIKAAGYRERIAELEALVASQRAEMEALTAPSVAPSQNTPVKAPDSPSKAPNRNR